MDLTNLDAEMIVIGFLIDNPDNFFRMTELDSDCFFHNDLREIYSFISEQIKIGSEVNIVRLSGIFPSYKNQLAQCLLMASGLAKVEAYSDYLRELSFKRKFKNKLIEILDSFSEKLDPFEKLEELHKSVGESKDSFRIRTTQEVGRDIYDSLDLPKDCFSTGISRLDEAMQGGLYLKKTYCIAARQKIGKTIALASISNNLSEAGINHLFVAAEMGVDEIHKRNIAHDIGYNSVAFLDEKARKQDSFREKVANYLKKQGSALMVDAPSINFERLKSLIISSCRKKKIQGVVLDYLQIVNGKEKGETEADFQGRVAQWLAEVAKKENIFVLYAAQLNREGQIRGSDGIRNAVDQLYTLNAPTAENLKSFRYMKLEASRYTLAGDLGDEYNPIFEIDKHGPYLIGRRYS